MSILPTIRVVVHTLFHALAERVRRAWRRAARRDRTLRIGVDIRAFYEPLTGIGWYLHHLLHELAKHDDADDGVELYLFGDARLTDIGPHLHTHLPSNACVVVFDLRGKPFSRFSRAFTAAAYVVLMWLVDCDVVFGANFFLPRLHSSIAKRRVVTIHDLTYKRHPELLQKETLENLGRHMQRELALADAIICVSESTRRDLLAFYEIDPARAIAIPSGLGALPDSAPVDSLPARYILFVSTIEPRKNLGVLLDAYERGFDCALVVVGKIGWKSEAIVPRLHGRGVVHLDYLPPAQLATVYRNATAFVFPSLYEGFGFPLLEAMAHGVPTIAARSSSLPEIGGDATLYFEAGNADELEAHLRGVLGDVSLRAELIARGHAQVAQFRWDVTAKKTLEVFRNVAGT